MAAIAEDAWFAEVQISQLRNILLKYVASLGMTILKKFGVKNPSESKAAVDRVNFMVKLLRAHGGCLGRSRRRRTW